MSKVIGVILAGGRGSRFGSTVPKQFVKLAGKLIIEYTIEVFQKSSLIDEIVVVSTEDFLNFVWELTDKNQWTKVSKVIVGGAERFDSTKSAIDALFDYDENTKILFHDAARPLVTNEIILRCIDALDIFTAVDVVIPSSDTIVQITDNGNIATIPVRSSLRRGQTPQAFSLKTIREAYANAIKFDRKDFTCDCGVVRAMVPGIEVATVLGDVSNLKITNGTDLFLAEKLIQTRSLVEITGKNQLSDIKNKVVVILGGSYGIGKSIADLCLQYGAKVYCASRSSGVNVSNKDSIDSFLDNVMKDEKQIDYIVNTAGILIKKPLSTMTNEELQTVVSVNMMGAINVAYAARPYLQKSQGGLLNFTSSSYTRGRAFYALYSATKAGVVNLTQALSDEWSGEGIRVNCMNPERTDTPMRRSNFGIEPAGSLLSPEVVARSSILTLLSDYTGLTVDVKRK